MEICQVSASAQAIVSWGGIQLQFSDLQGLTLLHTHRLLKGIYMGFGAMTQGPQETSALLEWELESGRTPQDIANGSRPLRLSI